MTEISTIANPPSRTCSDQKILKLGIGAPLAAIQFAWRRTKIGAPSCRKKV